MIEAEHPAIASMRELHQHDGGEGGRPLLTARQFKELADSVAMECWHSVLDHPYAAELEGEAGVGLADEIGQVLVETLTRWIDVAPAFATGEIDRQHRAEGERPALSARQFEDFAQDVALQTWQAVLDHGNGPKLEVEQASALADDIGTVLRETLARWIDVAAGSTG